MVRRVSLADSRHLRPTQIVTGSNRRSPTLESRSPYWAKPAAISLDLRNRRLRPIRSSCRTRSGLRAPGRSPGLPETGNGRVIPKNRSISGACWTTSRMKNAACSGSTRPAKTWRASPSSGCMPCSIADRRALVSQPPMDMHIHRRTHLGLVSQAFTENDLAVLPGFAAIGHTRYSTTGQSSERNAGPMLTESAMGRSPSDTTATSSTRSRCATSSKRVARSSSPQPTARCWLA